MCGSHWSSSMWLFFFRFYSSSLSSEFRAEYFFQHDEYYCADCDCVHHPKLSGKLWAENFFQHDEYCADCDWVLMFIIINHHKNFWCQILCRLRLGSTQWEVTRCSSKRYQTLTTTTCKLISQEFKLSKIQIYYYVVHKDCVRFLTQQSRWSPGKWITSESVRRSALLQNCSHYWSGITSWV